MKKGFLLFLMLAGIAGIAVAWLKTADPRKILLTKRPHISRPDISHSFRLEKLAGKAKTARDFIADQHFNQKFCFLVDMSLPSGQNRFFVYDLQNDSVLSSGLVTHGRCNEDWLNGRKYDNGIGSGCTSLGKYRIGKPYTGRFGLAFKLYGLDKTNSNAYARYVVLHSHECVPENEVSVEICQSDGCPTVSPHFLKELSMLITASPKPVLMWIYH